MLLINLFTMLGCSYGSLANKGLITDLNQAIKAKTSSLPDIIQTLGHDKDVLIAKINGGPLAALVKTTVRLGQNDHSKLHSERWTSGDFISLHLTSHLFLTRATFPQKTSYSQITRSEHYKSNVEQWIQTGNHVELSNRPSLIVTYNERFGNNINYYVKTDIVLEIQCPQNKTINCQQRVITSTDRYNDEIRETYTINNELNSLNGEFYDSFLRNKISWYR